MEEWLGKEGHEAYKSFMIKMIQSEFRRIEKNSKKAMRNLKNAAEGNPLDP